MAPWKQRTSTHTVIWPGRWQRRGASEVSLRLVRRRRNWPFERQPTDYHDVQLVSSIRKLGDARATRRWGIDAVPAGLATDELTSAATRPRDILSLCAHTTKPAAV